MKKNKIFGIGAVVLMLLVAMIPAFNAAQLDTEKNIFCTNTEGWDIKFTIESDPEFISYNEKNDRVTYSVSYIIENVGEGVYEGILNTELTQKGKDWVIAEWDHATDEDPLVLAPGEVLPKTKEFTISSKEEYLIAGNDISLKCGLFDVSGGEDPGNGNNVDHGFGNFWTNGFVDTKCHLQKSLPHEKWIKKYETLNIGGVEIELPVFKINYFGTLLPTIASSNRLGWIWDFIDYFIDYVIALCAFLKEFIDVAADIVLLVLELEALIADIVSMFTTASTGVIITSAQVQTFSVLLGAIVTTVGKLMVDLDELPVDPGDPLRVNLGNAGDALLTYLSTRPWTDTISITGKVSNCQEGTVKLDCRNVQGKNIPGGSGTRNFPDINVDTTWKSGDGLIFRNCQTTVRTGDQSITSRPILSYAAPGGSLHFIGSFNKGKERTQTSILQQIFEKIPILKTLFSFNTQFNI